MGWLDIFKSKPQPVNPRKQIREQAVAKLGKLQEAYDGSYDTFDAFVDRFYSNSQWWFPTGSIPAVGGTSNKVNGVYRYVFYHEQDLRWQRDAARLLYAKEPVAKAIERNLNAFTVGKGMTYKLCLKKGMENLATEEQLAEYQAALDDWMDSAQWPEREQECYTSKVVDGEFFLWITNKKGVVTIRRIEPEHIQNPPGATLDDGWWLGVKYDPRDYEQPVAYGYKHYNMEWMEIPASQIIHYKGRNVTRNVARGVSDLYPILDDLNSIANLSDNMREGATARAEIAYMWSIKNANAQVVSAFADEQADYNRTNPITGRVDKSRGMKSGKAVAHGDNVEYTTMPQGDSLGYIEIYQNSMRVIAAAFCMPEYMLTSDASNANYSSTLVAGTPFYRYIECEQNALKRPFKQVMKRVIEQLAVQMVIPTNILPFLDIDVGADSPVVVDPYQDAQRRDIEVRNGVLSPQTWCAEKGRDYEKEQENIDEWRDKNMESMMQQQGQGQQPPQDGQQQGQPIDEPKAEDNQPEA